MSEAAFFPWIETFYLKLLQVSQMFIRGQTDFLPHEMAVVLLLLVILVLTVGKGVYSWRFVETGR